MQYMEACLSQRRAAAALTVSGNELSSSDEDVLFLPLNTPSSFKAALSLQLMQVSCCSRPDQESVQVGPDVPESDRHS